MQEQEKCTDAPLGKQRQKKMSFKKKPLLREESKDIYKCMHL